MKREGLEEDEDFLEGDEPKDLLAVMKKLDQLADALYTGLMRKYGEDEMAELWLHNKAEYDRRREAGKEMLYAEPEIARASEYLNELHKKVQADMEKEQLAKGGAQDEGRKDD